MNIPEKAAQIARDIAQDDSHGYDQSSRWGPDFDCSSLVIYCYREAGVPLTCTFTGNMRSDMLQNGFAIPVNVNLQTGAGLQTGDVLLNELHHAAMYVGSGQIVNAGGNENHQVTGGKTGDQTGEEIRIMPYYNFPWDYVLRYVKKDEEPGKDDTPVSGEYTVQPGDTLWGIAEKLLGSGYKYQEIMSLNHLTSVIIHPGQKLQIPGFDGNKTISVTVTAETYNTLLRMSEEQGKTIGEIIDELV